MSTLHFGAEFKRNPTLRTMPVRKLEANIQDTIDNSDGLRKLMQMPGTDHFTFQVVEYPGGKGKLALAFKNEEGSQLYMGDVSPEKADDKRQAADLMFNMGQEIIKNNKLLKQGLASIEVPNGETPDILGKVADVVRSLLWDLIAVEFNKEQRLSKQ
jgi:hypothetical protein